MPYFAPRAEPHEWRLNEQLATPPLRVEPADRDGTCWMIASAVGINCAKGPGGAVLFTTRAEAEAVLRYMGANR